MGSTTWPQQPTFGRPEWKSWDIWQLQAKCGVNTIISVLNSIGFILVTSFASDFYHHSHRSFYFQLILHFASSSR